jgi:hypothetical protein
MENTVTFKSELGSKIRNAAASPNTFRLHIIAKNSQWMVKKEGAIRATKIYKVKKEAIHGAISAAKKGGLKEIIIHKKDGTIESVKKL